MRRSTNILFAAGALLAVSVLPACGKSGTEGDTNIVEMNASDGSMNDMTVVESSTLDQAGAVAAGNEAEVSDGGNASNAN